MFLLKFKTQVLGKEAADNLRRHQVTQTLRSKSTIIISVRTGEMLDISLDGVRVGWGRVWRLDLVHGDQLTEDDARRGGFKNLWHLQAALKRAGFRFVPLEEYIMARLQFRWIGGAELGQ